MISSPGSLALNERPLPMPLPVRYGMKPPKLPAYGITVVLEPMPAIGLIDVAPYPPSDPAVVMLWPWARVAASTDVSAARMMIDAPCHNERLIGGPSW